MIIDNMIFPTSIDLRGFDRDAARLASRVDSLRRDFARFAEAVKAPEIRLPSIEGSAARGAGADKGASDTAGALAQIASLRIPALDSIAVQVSRLAPLFEKMAGAIILSFRRADQATRLPLTKIAIEKTRAFIAGRMDSLTPRAAKAAAGIDAALAGLQFGQKVAGQVRAVLGALTSLDGKIARESGRALGPMQAFGPVGVKSLQAVEGAANRTAGSFRGLALQIAAAAGFTGLAYEATSFFKSAIKGASDYNETLSASVSILGDNAAAARKLSDGLARDFGLAKNSTLQLQSSIGGLLKGAGFSGKGLDQKLEAITRRAADLTSNQNAGDGEVGKSFLIQLSGEQSDFLKRLGVDTTETTLKQYALANGIAKAGAEMSNQQKVLARLGIVMEKTAFAQDDLKNTIDGPANAYRRFQGQVENFATTLGTAFLPVASKALGYLNELATRAGGMFDGNSAGMAGFIAKLNEAVDTAAIFTRNWDIAFEVIELRAGAWIHNFGEGLSVAIPNALHAIDEWFSGMLAKVGMAGPKLAAPEPGRFIDADAIVADAQKRMADREFLRRGGSAPLAPTIATPKIPPKPVDEAALKAANDAAEKMKGFVKSFTDKVRTPFQEYQDIAKQGIQAFKDGLISKDQLAGLDAYAMKESGLDKQLNPKVEFAGAAERGSGEYQSALNRAVYGAAQKPDQEQRKVGKDQLAELKDLRQDINRLLGGPKAPEKPRRI